jgi:hypothetical protein
MIMRLKVFNYQNLVETPATFPSIERVTGLRSEGSAVLSPPTAIQSPSILQHYPTNI